MKCLRVFVVILIGFTSLVFGDDITNTSGKVYSNVKVSQGDVFGVNISHKSGVARVLFSEMTAADRMKFGFDPVAAQKRITSDKERIAEDEKYKEKKLRMEKYTFLVDGNVLQVMEKGVLVHKVEIASAGIDSKGNLITDEKDPKYPVFVPYEDVVYVETNPDKYVDNQRIHGRFYRYGKFKYTSVNGALCTVHAFSPDIDVAITRRNDAKIESE